MNFLKSLKLYKRDKEHKLPSSFRIGELVISDLKPLGGMFKKGVTKAGRISLSGTLDNGKKVKIYESFKSSQINLRKKVGDQLKNEDVLLPSLIAKDENFIVEEWIEGKNLSKINPDYLEKHSCRVINFLKKIHSDYDFIEISNYNKNAFCYLSEYLLIRLKKWERWNPVENLLKEWLESNLETDGIIQSRVSHPDLSLSNIILTPEEKLYIVDNELIGVGKGWLLDERNSFFRGKINQPELDKKCKYFYNLSWKLRLVGSAIDQGDFFRAERMADLQRM